MPPQKLHAIVRKVSRSLAKCELWSLPRQAFDLELATRQHANYVAALTDAGAAVTELPEEPDLPDSTFVEDVAVVLDEVAILCRPGVASRQPETAHIAEHLAKIRTLRQITPPGTLEGGDVLRLGRDLYVGRSSRSNAEGIRQLTNIVAPFGYRVVPVNVTGSLHLKTAVTSPAEQILVANPDWVDLTPFHGFEILRVPESEPWGANVLPIGNSLLVAALAPLTTELLLNRGLPIVPLDISELQKAEAGLTCLTIIHSKRA